MKNFIFAGLLVWLSIFFISTVQANEPAWQYRFKKDNVSVYTRKLNSALLEFKSDVIVSVPIDQVVAFYENYLNTPSWYFKCTQMKVIKDEGPLKKIFYFVMRPPWPVSERDAVFTRVKSIDPSSGVVTFHLTALPDGFPQQKGKIRVPYLDIIFRFTPVGQGKTEMYFQQSGEAGGYIPAFIANALAVETPLNSLKTFKKLVECRIGTQIASGYQADNKIEIKPARPEGKVKILDWKDRILRFFKCK